MKNIIILMVLVTSTKSFTEAYFDPIINAQLEYIQKIDSDIKGSIMFRYNNVITSCKGKDIYIDNKLYSKLDNVAKRVTILRSMLHCWKGYPYLKGISIMNLSITHAVAAYEYGAN